jgi:hypothetical protein
MPSTLQQAAINGLRKLYLTDGASTPVLSLVPTTSIDENSESVEQTWFSSADVGADGTAYENGAITAQKQSYKCTAKLFLTSATTPAMVASLGTIRACKGLSGMAVRKQFVVVEADGNATIAYFDVKGVTTTKGGTEGVPDMEWTIVRRGIPATYAGTFPA